MASSSTSSIPKSFKYDVFLSFRGEDTRHTFVDHLYNALQRKGIRTYKDDEKIKKGKKIRDDLFASIEESRFYIIVFSKTYASSSWCLDELVKIMECQKMTEHTAYPVFYHVEPTEVRKQSGAVGEAFAKHENKEAAGSWKEALEDASHLAGWEYNKNNGENRFIEQIVHEISLELRSSNFLVNEKLIGMETRINEIVSSLKTSSDDVRMFGIVGMGGAGKTTLARAVYDKISFLFEGKSFVENVREVSNSLSGLTALQNQVILDVSNGQSITISNVFDGKAQIIKSMRCRKVIVVLDDVDCIEQLEALAGDCNWFKPGSRVIITTRDKQVLQAHRVSFHDVTLLSRNEAICLLSRYAFGTETPVQGYEELSSEVVSYASGLPLTIKVLGSKLCGEDECTWIDIIERLKEIPLIETQKKLELSYDDLEDEHKKIFLDVACIMKGWRKDNAIRVLDSCGLHGRFGLRVLELKSLITIFVHPNLPNDPCLGMHDHIEEMGWNIVRRPCHDKPHTHRRLWKDEEIEEVLPKDLGSEATCMKLRMKTNSKIAKKGFRKMKNLRFLHLVSIHEDCSQINFEDEVSQFPDALRYLLWEYYPFPCLPKTFRAKNLVGLEMPLYRGEQLWENGGGEVLDKLKFLVLNYSSLTTLNLGITPNLEILCLKSNCYLEKLHMPNKLQKLKSIVLTESHCLKSFDLRKTPNLETLDLTGSSSLEKLHIPDECPTLKSFIISFTNIESFVIGKTAKLEKLKLTEIDVTCMDLIHAELHALKSILLGCPNLSTIDLRRSSNLKELFVDLWDSDLKLNIFNLQKLHMPNELQKLKVLYLKHPRLRTIDLGQIENRDPLSLEGSDESEDNHMVLKCPNLQNLHLGCSKLETLNLQMNPSLEIVYIYSTDLIRISGWASKLKSLEINGSKHLETLDLSQAMNVEALKLTGCLDLVKLDMPIIQSKLKSLSIDGSKLSTFDLGMAPNLEDIFLRTCSDLVEVDMHVGYPKLRDLSLHYLPKLRTLDFAMTPNLECLHLRECKDLVLKMPLKFPKLKKLQLVSCSMLKTLKLQTPSLKSLYVGSSFHLTELALLGDCPKLNILKIESCHLFKKLPENLGRLECLEELTLQDCKSLQDISSNIGKMRSLRTLSLRECTAVEKLPEELGRLENLRELDIQYTGISHLPESIVLYKDLRIIGSKRLLKSCRFTSQKETSGYQTFYYRGTHSSSLLYRDPPTTGDSSESLKRQRLSIEEA